jgi:hypothetical protein
MVRCDYEIFCINFDANHGLEPKRLFSLLDLDAPGMEKVKAAVQAVDYDRAEEELLNYMRNRKNVRTVIP